MRNQLVLSLLLCVAAPAYAEVSVYIGTPHVSIGINVPVYPQLVRVPGYPVYYAPDEDWNYFFYDGMYWVYQDDYWYSSTWYNGPWYLVEPEFVPVFVLRVPVRYYRRPPVYFRGWQADRPPRWDDHWGRDWSRHHSGWDRWDRHAVPAPAPLPTYQRQYAGDRYPRAEQQPVLNNQHYRYQPHDPLVRQREQPQHGNGAAAPVKPETRPDRQDRQDRNSAPRMNEHNQPSQPNRQHIPEAPRDTPRNDRHEQRNEQRPEMRSPDAAPRVQAPRHEQNPDRNADREKDRGNNGDRGRDR